MDVLFWIFLDQICPKWIKLDQTWSNWISHQSKNVTIKSCHIYRKDRNDCFIFDFFGSDLSKMDQTWSNFLARNGFLAVIVFLQKLLLIQKYFCENLKWLFGQKGFFLARNGFFQMNLPYFSKYWKVWLAFDGWKLSGLFFHNFGTSIFMVP